MTIDYARARELMVEQQVRPWDVLDMAVLDVIGRLPREAFVAEQHQALAYADIELPLGHGEKMMKPVVEGRALQALQLRPGDSVLEVGTGSGYLSACLGMLAREVVSLELVPELAAAARARAWTPPAWATMSASRSPTRCVTTAAASSMRSA